MRSSRSCRARIADGDAPGIVVPGYRCRCAARPNAKKPGRHEAEPGPIAIDAGRLAAAVRVRDYFAFANATAVSSMRFEKPHSLSYQLDTLTRRPDTLVSVASNVDEAGLWLKSIDTSGASL